MSQFFSFKKCALGTFFFCAITSTIFGMEYEVQLSIIPHHKPKHHMKSCIILGKSDSPDGIITFYGHKELPVDIKAAEGEVQQTNLDHKNFKIIYKALLEGAHVSIGWDEIYDTSIVKIKPEISE